VTFNNGVYSLYWNGILHLAPQPGSPNPPFAPNTHSAATLGFKDTEFGAFNGYIDDVSSRHKLWQIWDIRIKREMKQCIRKGDEKTCHYIENISFMNSI
jgi:hypothetical protein